MKTGVIIQARMGSTRLPGKVLMEIKENVTMLEYMINRVKKSNNIDGVIIATSTCPKDDKIYDFCKLKNIKCFRGDENDVLSRYYDCSKHYSLENIVRLTADCPLIDPETIDICLNEFFLNQYEYFANTASIKEQKSMYPDGSDVEVFSFQALEETYKKAVNKKDREHVTFYMWKYDNNFKAGVLKNKTDMSKFRYTVDYPEDLEVVRFLVSEIENKNIKGSVLEIVNIIKNNHEIFEKNNMYYPGIGW